MNKKAILLSVLAVTILLCVGGAAVLFENRSIPAPSPTPPVQDVNGPVSSAMGTPVPSPSPMPVEGTAQGTVLTVDDSVLFLQREDGITAEFDITAAQYSGAQQICTGDNITISYHNAEESAPAVADLIVLIAAAQTPIPEPTAPPATDEISAILDTMTLEEKVGQLFLARCPSTDQAYSDITDYELGGYMLFGRDVKDETKDSLREKISRYQTQSTLPMLIAIDEEGGTVNRLSNYSAFRAVPFWSPQDLYAEGGMELILSDLEEKAALLLNLGINVNLAPVADVSTDSDDFINARSFGKDAQATADYISQVVIASKTLGLGTTLKHFPGYGNNEDTHTGIATDNRPYETFLNTDLLPFSSGIQAGADSILVSHNIVTSIDSDMPASLSAPIHRLLREDLGFTGVIMTDDLDMQAIQQFTDWNTSAVTALLAGNDLILCSNYGTQIPSVIQAVQDGTISKEQIDQSARRILTWKKDLNLF